jgi:HSP20 family protein
MKLIRRPSRSITGDIFSDFFDDFWGKDFLTSTSKLAPAVDIAEEKDKYIVKADLPGMKQDDIKVELSENVLSISGERKHEKNEENKDKHYYYYERSYGAFERKFVLPSDADVEKINANYKDGVLTIEIQKKESKKPKQIKVE